MKPPEHFYRINENKLVISYEIFNALAHPLRLEILNFIAQKVKTNVGNIYHKLDIPQSVTSQQLKILKDAKLVLVEKLSKERIYSINMPLLKTIQEVVDVYFID